MRRPMNPTPRAIAAPRLLLGALFLGGVLAGCAPTVKIEAPKEPITINLNIKLDADIRVRVEDKAKEDIDANPDVF